MERPEPEILPPPDKPRVADCSVTRDTHQATQIILGKHQPSPLPRLSRNKKGMFYVQPEHIEYVDHPSETVPLRLQAGFILNGQIVAHGNAVRSLLGKQEATFIEVSNSAKSADSSSKDELLALLLKMNRIAKEVMEWADDVAQKDRLAAISSSN